jgi:hypothetical protein
LRPRTLIYVAGPSTGKGSTPEERRAATIANIGRAVDMGVRVSRLGAHPIVPHANGADRRYWDPEHPLFCGLDYDFWIEATDELLLRCDAVLFLDNWQDSSGARKEERSAAERGIPRFYSLSDLACWLLPGLADRTGQSLPVLDESGMSVADAIRIGLISREEALTGFLDPLYQRVTEGRDTSAAPGIVYDDEGSYCGVTSSGPVTLSDLAKTIPTMAPEQSLADPFDLPPPGETFLDIRFGDDEPPTSPEIPSLRPAMRPPSDKVGKAWT